MSAAHQEGRLHGLVWPLSSTTSTTKAERWIRRLEQLGAGDSELDRGEVATSRDNIG